MSTSTFKILFYVRKNYLNKQGKASIMIRVTINGDVSQFSSKLDVDPNQWDTYAGKVKGNSFESKKLNSILSSIRTSIDNHYHDLESRDNFVTAEKLRNAFLGYETRQQTLNELFQKHNDDVHKLIGISKSAATYQKYERARRHLEAFMNHKYNVSDIALKEINHMFITDLENYLRVECNCNANTTAKFIQSFRRVIIIEKNNGWVIKDPFINYTIRLKRVDRGYLTMDEIIQISDKQFEIPRLEQVKDIFIFSCFTGLAYIDVKNLTKQNIHRGFDGKQWISTKRQKTDTPVNVPLLKIPTSIIERYKDYDSMTLLPVISNHKIV